MAIQTAKACSPIDVVKGLLISPVAKHPASSKVVEPVLNQQTPFTVSVVFVQSVILILLIPDTVKFGQPAKAPLPIEEIVVELALMPKPVKLSQSAKAQSPIDEIIVFDNAKFICVIPSQA
jgi:hypothetical protein